MNDTDFICDVNADDFDEKVIQASLRNVVVVDFWAEWCSPCKMLGPVLENVVKSFKGKVSLAKVDVEGNQELAMTYNIQSIPAVKIFKDGEPVEEFIGVLPEHEVKRIITSVAGDETDDAVGLADKYFIDGMLDDAEKIYKSALENNKQHSGALIGLAKIAVKNNDLEHARELLGSVQETDERYVEAGALLTMVHFIEVCTNTGGLEKNKKLADQEPENLEILYNLGCCYAVAMFYQDAFETFFSILEKKKDFKHGKAKEAVLSLFVITGQTSELTSRYRGRLASILF